MCRGTPRGCPRPNETASGQGELPTAPRPEAHSASSVPRSSLGGKEEYVSGARPMKDLDYTYAPAPHNMLTDRFISAEAVRVWGIIHFLKWNRIDPRPETIAEMM